MTFEDLLSEIKKIKWEEIREQTDNYLEVVVGNADLDPLKSVLQSYFGTPIKPEGKWPSWNASRQSKSFGGVRRNQTMYFQKSEQGSEIALLWPWGCGTVMTVKIARN